jgi:hypothetical protein
MRKFFIFTCTAMLIVSMTACSSSTDSLATQANQAQNPGSVAITSATVTAVVTQTAEITTQNSATHEDTQDYIWDSASVVPIVLTGNAITATGDGVTINGSIAMVTSAGTYSLSGSLIDGQIVVDTQDQQVVRLILNGVDIHNTTGAAINILNAQKTIIVLADDTENTITDGKTYTFKDPTATEPNAAIFSKSDLTIFGGGSLTVNGNYNDAIASKDGLIIAGGTITVNAVDDGIRGKDYLVVEDGKITIIAGGDGLKSDNEEDPSKGYIAATTGVFNITSSGDAIQAQTDLLITDGEFKLTTGGGSKASLASNSSAKGIDGNVNVLINDGTFDLDTADDSVHSNASLTINGGSYSIATGDDGMHADATLEINGGDINITQSYEGIESAVITINGGSIHVVSSDDGINVAGGNDGSGMIQGMRPGGPQRPGAAPAQDTSTYTGKFFLYIHGGYIVVVDAAGDGIDVNGAIEMTDGVVIVNGPTQQMNGALDYDAYFKMTGGFLVAVGSSGMAQAPGATSSQASALIYFNSTLPANTLVHIQNNAGEDILTFSPTKQYQSVAFSSPELVNGGTYAIYTGGSSPGTQNDGLYQDAAYQPGTQFTTFTITGAVTTVGSAGGRQRP